MWRGGGQGDWELGGCVLQIVSSDQHCVSNML